ncbi:nucleolin-like [Liolophura sinensis]|uniref:nucleolin-like n=1 Tax=Liolophura sinensis TaxID=3198878 RepID=UPI0031588A82
MPRRQTAKAKAAKAAKAKKAAAEEEANVAAEDTSTTEDPEKSVEVENEEQDPQQGDDSALMGDIDQALADHEEATPLEQTEGQSLQTEGESQETEGESQQTEGESQQTEGESQQTEVEGQQIDEGQPEDTETQDAEMTQVGDGATVSETAVEGEEQSEEAKDGDENNLFAIDKTPMDDKEMASKIEEKDGEESANGGKVWPEPEKELPLKGRVLRVHPVQMQHLTSKAMAPILKASLGYIIRSEGGSLPMKKAVTMDSTRSLEIWFHSDEEAEEMFVKLCNFKWNVNGRPARVVRVNSPESVDVTLKEWDKVIAPMGMYDGRCLFVNNIPANTTEEDLTTLFEKTKKIQIPTDTEGNQQGYALIEFWNKSDAVEFSKKRDLTLQENVLTLHTIGIQRVPRTKAAQERLDKEMKRIREQGGTTDFPTPRNKGPRNSTDRKRDDRRQNQGGRNRRDGNRSQGGNWRDGNRRGGGRSGGYDSRDGGWGNKRRFSGGRDNASPMKRGRMDRGRFSDYDRPRGRFGDGRGSSADNIRGELLDQMQNLQQGGISDPQYLMRLAKRLQQAQQGSY